jgi:alanyl-tRNA synthetase
MTERLYYDDAYITHFEARVLGMASLDGRSAVLLNRTFFYPTSGGQQHDRGTLNGIPVVDVQVAPEGDIYHLLAKPLPPAAEVSGEIDWPRRYDHMQQHSGQHLLSQAFYHILGLETVSVHFGEPFCTLDLDIEDISPAQLVAVEEHANAILWENRPIYHYWITDAELGSVPLRRPPKVSGKIRIVEIEAYDWSACGGTHVRRTGEIGMIALLRVEKMRRQSRVHFLCGRRVLNDYRSRRILLGDVAALLDTHYEQAPELVGKLQNHNKEMDKQIRALQEEVLGYRARTLLASARFVGNVRIVAQVQHDLDPNALKGLAQRLAAEPRTVALLCCESGGKGTAIFARAEGVDLNAGQLLRDVLREFGGGGGGRPDFAQGGGMSAETMEDVLAAAAQRAAESLPQPIVHEEAMEGERE